MKSDYALKAIEVCKKALADEAYLISLANKNKVNPVRLKEEYKLFLEIEDLKDNIDRLKDEGQEEKTVRVWQTLQEKTAELIEIQRSHE